MDPTPVAYNPHTIEAEVLALWKARRLPPSGGVVGPPRGPTLRQFTGGWTPGDFPSLVAHRAVVADVDARYLGLTGRRAAGTLRQEASFCPGAPSTVPALLSALGIWTGGDGRAPWDSEDRLPGVRGIVARLAEKGVLVTRDESFRVCPTCGTTRSPDRIIYDEQEGDTYLVRFPVRVGEWAVNALVWVDAPWKLLGASAILVNPTLRYSVVGYHRREERELVLTSMASLDRLRSWIPDATFEVVEEKTGREFQGLPYVYPLRHEFPMGGDLTPPAGTILGAADVGDSGTGIVPLVPGHGPTDAQIAARAGVSGWPLLTPKGMLDVTLMHKYAGLDLETADEFVLRDLSEAGAVLAHLRVKRGVPHCAVCGSSLLWAPGRAWCLEPARLPPEVRATFSRLLPGETLPGQTEVAPWPVSEATPSDTANAVELLECARCERLADPGGPKECPCGGQRTPVRRRLLPSCEAALSAAARFDPFPEGDSARLYVGHRRRVPSLVNYLAALSGIAGPSPTVNLTVVPTVAAADTPGLVTAYGADAVRSALVRSGLAESSGGHLADLCRQESERLRRWWLLAHEVSGRCTPMMLSAFAQPISGFLGELEVEDRAILARWERTRTLALANYDQWTPGVAHRNASRFLDNDLAEYRELIEPRLALAGAPPTKTAALRTVVHLLRGLAELLAPVAPFTSEAVHRFLSAERTSLFEQPMAGLDRALVNDDLVAAWDRWRTVLRSVDRFRRSVGVPRSTPIPSLVLVLPADDIADRFRAEKEVLARITRAEQIEIGSPREPWMGRRRVLRPIESEIQKLYPTEASQIAHLLQRMGPRRWEATAGQEPIDVVINGLPRRVYPTMVSVINTLPERVVAFPWSLGDMYLETPAGTAAAARRPLPPLSSNAFWLVRRVERRLRSIPAEPGSRPRVAIATAKDPLASELRLLAEPIAQYLGLGEFRVVETSEEAVPPNALTGRTRTGERWWVHVPGLPVPPPREKRPSVGVRAQRVPVAAASTGAAQFDYADEKFVAHEEAVRTLGQELDDLVGIPLLGPAKVEIAWEHGVHSVDDLKHSRFETVSALPGFGGPVAVVVLSKLGSSVPSREVLHARRGPAPGPSRRVRAPAAVPAPLVAAPAVPASLGPVTEARESIPVSLPVPRPPAPISPAPPPEETRVEVEAPPEGTGEAPVPGEAGAEQPPTVPITAPLPFLSEEAEVQPEVPHVEEPAAPPQPSLPEETVPPAEEPTPPAPPLVEPVPPEEAVPEPPLPEAPPEAKPEPEGGPVVLPSEVPPEQVPVVAAPPAVPEEGAEAPAPAEPVVPEPLPPSEPSEPFPAPETEAPAPPEEVGETTPTEVPSTIGPLPKGEAEAPAPVTEGVPEAAPPEVEEAAPPEEEAPAPSESTEATATTPAEAVPPPVPEVEAPVVEAVPPPEAPETVPPAEEARPAPIEEVRVAPEPVPEAVPPSPVTPMPEGLLPKPEIAPPPAAAPTPAVPAVTPPVPPVASLPSEPEPPPPPSGVELTVGGSLVGAMVGFLDATAAGHHGVCVVRESPERIRARLGSRPTEVFWLTNIGRGPSVRPADLEGAWAFLSRKLIEEHATAFFLEGIEYLVRLHGADAVLTGLVQLDRLAREHDARIWIYLAPALMLPADLERFESTFGSGAKSS